MRNKFLIPDAHHLETLYLWIISDDSTRSESMVEYAGE